MQFLYPQFLFALFALAIPVIIHLFNFRRYKRILFTNVQFIAAVKESQKSKNKLRHLLILLARMLAIACVVIAFAQPYFSKQETFINPGKKYVAVYIDNSFSMSNTASKGELLEVARTKAADISKAFKESDAFMIITNDFELRHQRWLNRSEFLKALSEIKISPAFHRASDIYSRMQEGFRKADNQNHIAYMISDFQKQMANFNEIKEDTTFNLSVLPIIAEKKSNIYIDSAWFETALWQKNKTNVLNVKIVNSSSEEVKDGTLTLTVNNKQKAIASYNIAPHEAQTVRLTYTITESGINEGLISIEDYPIVFDNKLYFNYDVSETFNVLVINGGASSNVEIGKAFAAEEAFKVTQVSAGNIDYSALNNFDFIVLNGLPELSSGLSSVINSYLTQKGNVLVIPPDKDLNFNSYSSLGGSANSFHFSTSAEVDKLSLNPADLKKPFFKNIFDEVPQDINMPFVNKFYNFTESYGGSSDDLLRIANGSSFLNVSKIGSGNLFMLAVPLSNEWSNLTSHALFLPILYKMAFYKQTDSRIYYILGEDNFISLPNTVSDQEKIFKLTKDSIEFIPPQRALQGKLNLFVENLIQEAGHYRLKGQTDNSVKKVYSFNYNRKESVMDFADTENIKDQNGKTIKVIDSDKEAKAVIEASGISSRLWKWFVLAGILFLFVESLLIRIWK